MAAETQRSEVHVTRSWRVFPAAERDRAGTTRYIHVTEFADRSAVMLEISNGEDPQSALYESSIVELSPAEWRELTSLPVRFDEP